MLNFSAKILLSLGLLFSVQVKAGQYTSIHKTNNFSEVYGLTPSEHQIIFYSQFLSPSEFSNGNRFYGLVSGQLGNSSYEIAFVGRAAYQTHLSINKLTASFFQNIQNIRYLLGSEYSVQLIDPNPQNFIFQSSRNLPFGSDLTADVQMQVIEIAQADQNLLSLVQGLTGRTSQPNRLVIQDMRNFSERILLGRVVTALYSNPNQTTDIEVLNVSIFYDFPSFGRSYIENTAKQDLHGFAERMYLMP